MPTTPDDQRRPLRRVFAALLALAGSGCIVAFFSFHAAGGNGQTTFTIGFPDHWFLWENGDFGFYLSRWSVAVGILGVVCLRFAVRLWKAGHETTEGNGS